MSMDQIQLCLKLVQPYPGQIQLLRTDISDLEQAQRMKIRPVAPF